MNSNVFRSSYTSVSVRSSLRVPLSASVLKPIQNRVITTERIKPSIKSDVNTVSNVYWSNVLSSPLSFRDELETSRSEAVKIRNKTTSKKRLYWWF